MCGKQRRKLKKKGKKEKSVWKSKTETSHGTIKTRRTHFKEKEKKKKTETESIARKDEHKEDTIQECFLDQKKKLKKRTQ